MLQQYKVKGIFAEIHYCLIIYTQTIMKSTYIKPTIKTQEIIERVELLNSSETVTIPIDDDDVTIDFN